VDGGSGYFIAYCYHDRSEQIILFIANVFIILSQRDILVCRALCDRIPNILHWKEPTIVVEWLTLLFFIRDLPGSNLGTGDRLPWLSFFVVFRTPSRLMQA
jgi:hypothetical protein